MSDISTRAVVEPLLTALAPLGWSTSEFYLVASFTGLPLINQALAAKHGGESFVPVASEILQVIGSIAPNDVYNAQKYIQDHAEGPGTGPPPPPGPSGGGSSGKGTPPPAPPPIISAEAVAGPPDDFFTPMRIYGHRFAHSEAVALIQVLGGSQAPLGAAASDGSGYIDVTLSFASHTHYSLYAIGATSNVPSNTIGFATP